ncbi:MAG TPA: hypothetical protein VGK24_01315 [Candidatus Angelobacter sp.]|jgi:hypothetical protein
MTAPKPAQNGLSKETPKLQRLLTGDPISVSQGLTIVKEVWSSANRLAKLRDKYAGKAIPADELFGAILGIGGETNPLAEVEQKLSEISAKLDQVLAGIEQIRQDILNAEVRGIQMYIRDAVFVVDKYFQELSSFASAGTSKTAQNRAEFMEKLLGKKNERDAVDFYANQIVNLDERQRPVFFYRLFPSLLLGATASDAVERYMHGAFMLRWVTDALVKALLLELFVQTASGESSTMDARTEKVLTKYKQWMRMLADSLLDFAERLATLRFREEFNGGNTMSENMHLPFPKWTPAQSSMLQSADELAARLLGYTTSVTLRVIPNVPPVADLVPKPRPERAISAGDDFWEIMENPQTTVTKESILDFLQTNNSNIFWNDLAKRLLPAKRVTRRDITFLDGAALPLWYDKKSKKLSFVRLEFTSIPKKFWFDLPDERFPRIVTRWRSVYIEEGNKLYSGVKKEVVQAPITNIPGLFDRPAEGLVSVVLVTYAYDVFGHRMRS